LKPPLQQLTVGLLAIASALAQTSMPQFEVASVKQYVWTPERVRTPQARPQLAFLCKSGQLFKISGNRASIQGICLT
jgi:hypothetical protein